MTAQGHLGGHACINLFLYRKLRSIEKQRSAYMRTRLIGGVLDAANFASEIFFYNFNYFNDSSSSFKKSAGAVVPLDIP